MERGKQEPNLDISKEGLALAKIQSIGLKQVLDPLRIGFIVGRPKIAKKAEIIHSTYFDNRLTLAFTGMDETTMAILVSSTIDSNELPVWKKPIVPLAIVPEEEGLHLYRDPDSNTLWTDLFWVCENNRFKLIKPTNPVPVDGWMTMYDSPRDYEGLRDYLTTNVSLFEITENKWLTRTILEKTGLPVPKGVFIPRKEAESFGETFNYFIDKTPGLKGVVIKGNVGSGGIFVKLFGLEEHDKAIIYAQSLFAKNQDVIIEERIYPYPTTIAQPLSRPLTPEEVDYNFRVLVTLEPCPRKIDAEIRYGALNGDPVNVHQGAKAVRPEKILPEKIVDRVYLAAERATVALWREINHQSSPTMGFVGIDIILGRDRIPYIIEANSGAVGGFGTLCRLDGKPLKSIPEILIPSTREFLLRNYYSRKPFKRLERFSPEYRDLSFMATSYGFSRKFDKSRAIMERILREYPEKGETHHNMCWVLHQEKKYKESLEHARQAAALEPNNPLFIQGVLSNLRKLGRYEEAEKYFIECGADKSKNPLLISEKAMLLIKTNRRAEARQIINDLTDFPEGYFKRARVTVTMVELYRELGVKTGLAEEALHTGLLIGEGAGRLSRKVASALFNLAASKIKHKK